MIENDLRFVIRENRTSGAEETWLRGVLGDSAVQVIIERKVSEASRRKPARVSELLLDYTTLAELRKCLNAIDWARVGSSLGKKAEFDLLLKHVERYRNTVAHSRELLQYEVALLEGVAGIIRTRVTIGRSSMDQDSEHYPVIEYMRDSFGNEATKLNPSEAWTSMRTGLTLQVGDVVTFTCRGWDAQGRELTWTLSDFTGPTRATATGTETQLRWVVGEEDVGASANIKIGVRSSGRYHRHSGHDQSVIFAYAVSPPTGAQGQA